MSNKCLMHSLVRNVFKYNGGIARTPVVEWTSVVDVDRAIHMNIEISINDKISIDKHTLW